MRKNVVQIQEGTEAGSFLRLLDHVVKLDLHPETMIYFVEDDYLHRPGWLDILLEGLSIADYATLYDHKDKYFLYPELKSRIFVSPSCHWRTTLSTTNTFALRCKTLFRDLSIHQSFSQGRTITADHEKFCQLQGQGIMLISPMPGWSTHAEPEFASPCIDWEQYLTRVHPMSCASTLVFQAEKNHSWLRSAGLVILSSFLISLFANISIPLPFTPVPIATQGSLILILSVLLGPKRAVLSVIGFLAQGAAGLPVFSGSIGGIAVLFGPTGGYLLGYPLAALLVGFLAERIQNQTPMKLFWTLAAGNATFFLFGIPYLAFFVGFKQALLLGLAPFVIGDLLKLVASVKILQWTARSAK